MLALVGPQNVSWYWIFVHHVLGQVFHSPFYCSTSISIPFVQLACRHNKNDYKPESWFFFLPFQIEDIFHSGKVLPSTLFYVLMCTSIQTEKKKRKKKTEANGSINWACCMCVKEFCRIESTDECLSLRFIRWRLWKIYENCLHWMETSGWIRVHCLTDGFSSFCFNKTWMLQFLNWKRTWEHSVANIESSNRHVANVSSKWRKKERHMRFTSWFPHPFSLSCFLQHLKSAFHTSLVHNCKLQKVRKGRLKIFMDHECKRLPFPLENFYDLSFEEEMARWKAIESVLTSWALMRRKIVLSSGIICGWFTRNDVISYKIALS